MTKSLRFIGVLVAAIALSACGSSTSSSSSASSPSPSPSPTPVHIASVDACTLVTASEASAAAGATLVNLASVGGIAIPGACFYGAQNSSSGVFVYAQVYPDSTTANAVTADQFSAALGARIGVGATSGKQVSGIGDKAFEFTANGNAGAGIAIIAFKANVIVMIAVDPTADPSVVEGLARTAVGRLH